MLIKRLLAVIALCFGASLMLGLGTDTAYADAENDKKLAAKTGVSGSLAQKKEEDEGLGPSQFEMGLGFGSCAVAYIVMKWL